MKTKIFYFSATGNSLALARKIGAGLGDAELISIPRVLQEPVTIDVERVGLVFPVYAWGMPRIVHDFVKRLQIHTNPYIFAVATCAGVPGGGLKELAKIIRKKGGVLAAGFAVNEP
ncbi:MAG TPA: EFR1 family ferrodoxin, partial [Bacillota bacterium]|nr:EFR1 family ferrodoxin [Bacillota bacterium]